MQTVMAGMSAAQEELRKQRWGNRSRSLAVLQGVTLVPGKGGPTVYHHWQPWPVGARLQEFLVWFNGSPALIRVRQWPLAPALLTLTSPPTKIQPEPRPCWPGLRSSIAGRTIKQLHTGQWPLNSGRSLARLQCLLDISSENLTYLAY